MVPRFGEARLGTGFLAGHELLERQRWLLTPCLKVVLVHPALLVDALVESDAQVLEEPGPTSHGFEKMAVRIVRLDAGLWHGVGQRTLPYHVGHQLFVADAKFAGRENRLEVLSLSVSHWTCSACGKLHYRDLDAAGSISLGSDRLRRGQSLPRRKGLGLARAGVKWVEPARPVGERRRPEPGTRNPAAGAKARIPAGAKPPSRTWQVSPVGTEGATRPIAALLGRALAHKAAHYAALKPTVQS